MTKTIFLALFTNLYLDIDIVLNYKHIFLCISVDISENPFFL